jgi:hypothetical protein
MTAEAPYPPPTPPLIYYIYWFSLHEVAPYPVAVICPVAVLLLYHVTVPGCRALVPCSGCCVMVVDEPPEKW